MKRKIHTPKQHWRAADHLLPWGPPKPAEMKNGEKVTTWEERAEGSSESWLTEVSVEANGHLIILKFPDDHKLMIHKK